jgi:hypothetical protein
MRALVVLLLVHGVVMRGPTQPVCQLGKPCTEPARNVQLVFLHAGAVAARVRTGADGSYRVRLRRGVYTVRIAKQSVVRFTLRATQRLDFELDTGIR